MLELKYLSVLIASVLLMWVSYTAKALYHRAKHGLLSQDLEMRKDNREDHRGVAGPATASCL